MSWFLGGIAFLILGYFTYGRLVERIVGPDDRKTPCVANPDGVDFVPLPKWKNMLIQLLNIAGVGPVIGVILGIKFGKVALLIIPVGCVLMGAVHDYLAGMMSLRMNGANMPRMVREGLGKGFARAFAWFLLVLLLLVVAVFVNVPANLIDRQWLPQLPFFWWAAVAIFVYYIVATLFPVDQIIGRVYPVFGVLLIIGSLAIFVALLMAAAKNPFLLADCAGFATDTFDQPIFPCLFVTIACGIVSGFHATQSPIVARTCISERQARTTFYGMMILEGVIAMIWAAAALAIYNVDVANLELPGPAVLGNIANHFLGRWVGGVTVAAIVILAITSGDTALRSARLTFAEELRIDQKSIRRRILTTLPFIVVIAGLLWWSNASAKTFGLLWNYFAWGNQILAVTMLMTATVWLVSQGRGAKSAVTLLPGVFMCTVVTSFILWASPAKGQVWGAGLPYGVSVTGGFLFSLALAAYAVWRGRNAKWRVKRPRYPEARLNYLQSYVLSRIADTPSSQMFNLAKLFRLRKGIDLGRLSASLVAAGEAHGALRTVLRRDADGEIVQRQELPAGSVRCPVVKRSEADLLADRSALVKSFEVEGGCLFDATIFDCGERAYLLSNFHHLICDGYSFPLILADAHRAWNGETLEPDAYYGVLARREERAAQPIAVAGRNFMRELLKARKFATLPPPDFRNAPGYGMLEEPLHLPASFGDFLVARRATRHHVFLAAAAIALRRISGGADVLLDWVFHGRVSKDELKTVGAFMVDLPLVFDGTEDLTAPEVIALVKRATFNGIKGVNIFRDVTDCNPTGQDRLTFIYQDEWGELMSPGPVRKDGPYAWMLEETIPLQPPQTATENPFNVEIMEHSESTRLFIEYDTGRYSAATVRRYADLYRESLAWLLH